jgi:hypothetical protein
MALNLTVRRRPVELARRVPVGIDAAVDVLRYGADRLVGPELAAPWAATAGPGTLGVELPGGIHLTREVRIGFGPLFEEDGTCAVPVWWEAAEHPHLFPIFDGALEVRRLGDGTELRLVGSYEPPLGSIGQFADCVLGHRVVIASLEALLTQAAERLAAAVADEVAAELAGF